MLTTSRFQETATHSASPGRTEKDIIPASNAVLVTFSLDPPRVEERDPLTPLFPSYNGPMQGNK